MQSVTVVPQVFAASVLLAVATLDWSTKWLISGAPLLTYFILLGSSYGCRILPFLHLWTLLATINLFYSLAATSWLLYWVFAAGCYPAILLTCLFQFDAVGRTARRSLRKVLRDLQLQFLSDKIAFFDLPGLEIDTDVEGLMVVRGLTVHVSSLTVIAHGIEVGIKLSDDMELAIQVEEVKIPLFRRIEIGDVYANLKGGQFEMSFGKVAGDARTKDGEIPMANDTPMPRAATGRTFSCPDGSTTNNNTKMTAKMTEGSPPQQMHPVQGLQNVTQIIADDEEASRKYDETIRMITRTNSIYECRSNVDSRIETPSVIEKNFSPSSQPDRRAAICSHLHSTPTVAHPPRRSVKVTALQQMGPPTIRRLLHRMPLLYRLLLNPISYLHPVHVASITAVASGEWIQSMLQAKVFMHNSQLDSDIRKLEERMSAWLSDANFALELADIRGIAQVPIVRGFDISCTLRFGDVMAYRTLPKEIEFKQVVRLGGADATVNVPLCLLPHHEHWLPPRPTAEDVREQERQLDGIEGKPQIIKLQHEIEQKRRDEINVNVSAHARLPACFDQELLNFIAALVKATKIIEMEKEMSDDDDSDKDEDDSEYQISEKRTLKKMFHQANSNMRDRFKKAAVSSMANDRWIAKLVGKITRSLETAQGDAGYSGDVPVPLAPYRNKPDEGSKILP